MVGVDIYSSMAAHVVTFKNMQEFFQKMKDRDSDMIRKMAKTVIHAVNTNRKKIDVFQVIFSTTGEYIFTLDSDQYLNCLRNCMDDMIRIEEYELCSQIRDILQKEAKKTKKVLQY